MASNSKSEPCLHRYGYNFLFGSIFFVLTVPYTKVEEFQRSGALLVSIISAPFVLTASLLHLSKFYALLIV